ncbi:MAG: molybdopterin synthase sulfur carrier subunit [Gammaproteobacteria bacterium]|nr:molybdopterin synthase sulfur carrier subunit [Gammaproteobacteria bacterium]
MGAVAVTTATSVTTAVSVRFFASLREAVDREIVELALDEPSIAGVRAKLAGLLTKTQFEAIDVRGVQICVNQTIVRGDVGLEAGDEVAFLPPVTGG